MKIVANELEKQSSEQEIVIIRTSHCKVNFDDYNYEVVTLDSINLVHFFKSIYHLATSRYVFIDNYFGFLAVTHFKEEVKCIQLWHAVGAIKQFGLQDLSNGTRSQRALNRFQQVYNRFDYVVVGSDKMTNVFKNSFNLSDEHFLRTGIPRTDFFFDNIEMNNAKKRLQNKLPKLHDKQVLLYAPTYRDDELNSAHIALDLETMYKHFKDDYVLLLRLHPAIASRVDTKYTDFVYDMSHYPEINDLLVCTDILITDYSSIPFEYALLNKPMVFFAYDLEEYSESRGLVANYPEFVPGPVVQTTTDLIKTIEKRSFSLNKVNNFAQEWNKYSIGNSTNRLIHAIYSDIDVLEQPDKAMENV